MAMILEMAVVIGLAVVVGVVGVRVGMLVARPIERLADDQDEEPRGDH